MHLIWKKHIIKQKDTNFIFISHLQFFHVSKFQTFIIKEISLKFVNTRLGKIADEKLPTKKPSAHWLKQCKILPPNSDWPKTLHPTSRSLHIYMYLWQEGQISVQFPIMARTSSESRHRIFFRAVVFEFSINIKVFFLWNTR